ncbi:unnamed protein product [Musa hybrid cultivar]
MVVYGRFRQAQIPLRFPTHLVRHTLLFLNPSYHQHALIAITDMLQCSGMAFGFPIFFLPLFFPLIMYIRQKKKKKKKKADLKSACLPVVSLFCWNLYHFFF